MTKPKPDWWRSTDTPWGQMAYNLNDVYVGQSLHVYGEYAPVERRFLQSLVRIGDTVVEVGANIGALTVPLLWSVGIPGKVYAFEPQPHVGDLLMQNVMHRGLRSGGVAQLLFKAAGAAPGTARIGNLPPDTLNNFGGVAVNAESDMMVDVEVVTIDSLELEALRLLKADCEGWELAVIEGARDTIARCRPILYIEDDRADQSEALHALVRSLGYRLHRHKPPLFDPDNHKRVPFPTSQLGCFECKRFVVSSNLLAVPDEWDRQEWEPEM